MLTMQSLAIVSPTALKKYKKEFNSNPVGTGAFVFKKWHRNQRIILRANKDYWGGEPKLKTLIFRSIPDNNTRMVEMMAGNIHMMDNPNPDDINQLKTRLKDKLVFAERPGFNVGYLAFNMEKKPFNNKKVREAIAHAINKQGIVDAIYAGYAKPARHPMHQPFGAMMIPLKIETITQKRLKNFWQKLDSKMVSQQQYGPCLFHGHICQMAER